MRNNLIILALTGVALTVSSCRKGCTDPVAENYDARAKKNDNTCTYIDPLPTTSNVILEMTYMVGNESFALNTDFIDDYGNKYQFTLARFYVSSPEYLDDNMNPISSPSVYALVETDTNRFDFGTVPADVHVHMMNI